MPELEELKNLINRKLSPKESEILEKAYRFSKKAHENQKRMSGDSYFIHPFETAKTIARLGMDVETISAGLLHDILEDTNTTEEELREQFGENIVYLVNGVTKLGTLKYRGRERHVESLRKFFIAMTNDLRVVIIKFADRLHNLNTLSFLSEDKRKRIALESLEVYAPLANRLGMGDLRGEIEDASFIYLYPKEYQFIEEIFIERKEIFEKNLEEVSRELEKELTKNNIKFEMNYRLKHKYSLWKKLLRRNMDIEKINDIVALRVIVNSLEECYRVLGIVHSIWTPLPGRIKDYIALPKPNGYRSIHTSIFTGSGGVAEVQIRTKEMHDEALNGVAAHFAYKERKGKHSQNKENLKWMDELKNFNYDLADPKTYLEHLKTDFFNHRIFVFTPQGDVIDLPDDSSPIDFAYSIHSDIGDHIFAAKVNKKIAPIFSKLKNGDIIEIVTKKDAHPGSKWLEYTKTSVAKKHIRAYLDKNSFLNKLKSFGKN